MEPEKDEEAPKIGVYVCRCGGNISDVVDVERVAKTIAEMEGVAISKVHTFMCSDPGQSMIVEDIKKESLNRVVVASCSPFLHELTFRNAVQRGGLNPYLYDHVNIREQGSWAHKSDPEGATAKAIRLIAAGVEKVKHAEPLERIRLSNHQRALVLGGGAAGMKAALELARRGIPAVIIDKNAELGGHIKEWGKLFPTDEDGQTLAARLRSEVEAEKDIEVIAPAKVTKISGFVGNYDVAFERLGEGGKPGEEAKLTVGAIIVATGFEPYRPAEGEFGYRKTPRVMTMPEFIAWAGSQPNGRLTLDGREVRRVGFLHCVGSRQIEGVHKPQPDGRVNTYCSRVCCSTVLNQAVQVRKRFPSVSVLDFHQDIRSYGRGHEDYYIEASNRGVAFFRYHGDEPPEVATDAEGLVRLRMKDYLTWGEEIEASMDVLVLAVGMTPSPIGDLIDMLKLATGHDRFLQEVHPKLRPVESSVNGVFLAGTAQAPMTLEEALCSAGAAAAKAAALLGSEYVEVDPFVARVDEAKCTGCERCVEECAYSGAIVMVEKETEGGGKVKKAEVNAGLCAGCGACVAVCPTRAIDLRGWSLKEFDSMVDGLVSAAERLAAK
ncbi:MAG: CoB--CoM heterodisulfide reductase iron-sulfur subunit A family protein [Verrucomicrobia bacterium]|nr:CoB--CoM heterodisulfide reductase iron-sulfur subunit A family protein [Verrucomicrobiota bacterium]